MPNLGTFYFKLKRNSYYSGFQCIQWVAFDSYDVSPFPIHYSLIELT